MKSLPFHIWMILLFCASACTESQPPAPKIHINELMARNTGLIKDEAGEAEDWLELYNAEDTVVDVGGWYITDNLRKPRKWQIPVDQPNYTHIPSKAYLLIWFDKETEEGPLHANFKLNSSGEQIGLYAGETLVDMVKFGREPYGASYGRITEGKGRWTHMQQPSPGKANSDEKYLGITHAPSFSHLSGHYEKAFELELSTRGDGQVRYTTNGAEPDEENSIVYDSPVHIDSNIVIRARTFRPNYLPGDIVSKTYLFNEKGKLPLLCINVDPIYLYDKKEGIFRKRNKNKDLEHPANVLYLDAERKIAFEQNMGVKLQGRFARGFKKKSVTVVARKQYGKGSIKYPVFPNYSVKKFNGLIVRADCNYAFSTKKGKRQAGDRIRNELIYALNQQMGSSVIMQAYQPAEVFLNGRYWGLFNITERKGKDFLKSHYGVKDVDMVNPSVKRDDNYFFEVFAGDKKHYMSLVDLLNNEDIRNDSVYEKVQKMMDVENFIDGWVYEFYTTKGDPISNARLWRPRKPGGKWQSIGFDWDHWKRVDYQWLKVFVKKRKGKALFLNKLMKNRQFRFRFFNRVSDYLNTVMLPENIKKLIREIDLRVANEKIRDRQRWQKEIKYVKAGSQIKWMNEFADCRPDYLREEVLYKYKLPGLADLELKVSPSGGGRIQVNTIIPDKYPWTGRYFQSIGVPLKALPAAGYKFAHWKGQGQPTEPEMLLMPGETGAITAVFRAE